MTTANRRRCSVHRSLYMKGTMRSTLSKLKSFWGINLWFPLLWVKININWLWFGVLTQLRRTHFQISSLHLASISLQCWLLTYCTNLSSASGKPFLYTFSAYWTASRMANYMSSTAGESASILGFNHTLFNGHDWFSDIVRYLHLEETLFGVFQEIRRKWSGWQLTILKIFSRWVIAIWLWAC